MITKKELKDDSSFYIDEWNLDRILGRPIVKYKVEEIPLRKIWRVIDKKLLPLQETDIYKYIDGDENAIKNYKKYCKDHCKGNPKRGIIEFNELIRKFSKELYDPMKGAIVVDQLNFIVEGNHRCCILLKKYGPKYKVKVVKLTYKNLYIISRLKLLFAKIKYARRY